MLGNSKVVGTAAPTSGIRQSLHRKNSSSQSSPNVPSPFQESPEVHINARRQLQEAIDLLPDEETSAYRKAIIVCPELVNSESNPLFFLRCCGWDPWRAAARWMRYWNLRLEIFGPDRCYRSLEDFSGNGALAEIDVQIVETGVAYTLLQNVDGCVVVVLDRSKFPPRLQQKWNCTVENKQRASFYILHALAQQQPEASTNGVIAVQLVTMKDPKVYPAVNKFLSRALRDCFPYQLKALHMVFAPVLEKRRLAAFAEKSVPFLQRMVQQCIDFTRIDFHALWVEKSTEKTSYQMLLATLLQDKIGVKPETLPPIAGGKWSYTRYKRWYYSLQQQLSVTSECLPHLQYACNGNSIEKSAGLDSTSNPSN